MGLDRSDDFGQIFDPDSGPAETCVYTAPSGSPISTAVILLEGMETVDLESGEMLDPTDVALLPRSAVPKVVPGGRIVVGASEVPHGGETWVVLSPAGESRYHLKATVRKES